MKRVVLTVTKNEALTPLIYEMHLAGDVSGVTRAGQFVEIALDGLYLRRPISVCNYEEGELTIIYNYTYIGSDIFVGDNPDKGEYYPKFLERFGVEWSKDNDFRCVFSENEL